MGLVPVKALVRRCTNSSCSARHSYCTWKEGELIGESTKIVTDVYDTLQDLYILFFLTNAGVFNISNKLFVSLDILFSMRFHVQRGEPPGNCNQAIVDTACLISQATLQITSEEKRYLEQKLYDGYFAFEASTTRNWDNGICGICGVAPVFQSGDGNAKNCTPLKRNQVIRMIVDTNLIIKWNANNLLDNLER